MIEAGTNHSGSEIAIIGMAGRWPGARTPWELWCHVRDGIDCISQLSADELEVAGAAELAKRSDYVKARSVVDGVDLFDANFFGILPKEAELIDPQHRHFLECCWEALEDAGYDPLAYPGAIGVVAGCGVNTYFLRQVCADRSSIEDFTSTYPVSGYPTILGTLADTLATRVSYKLNLRGPSFTLQSACSTSLVAVCQACQSLLSFQSDMVLAGGVSITLPQKRGYLYQDGGMGSADGHCRPFEARASGTVFGNGAGVVLLKRLEDAVADGDHIYSVIKGFAVNNDGSTKVGFTAPSVESQAAVIALAQELAGIEADSTGYLEAHGTGTPLGDPIEFTALTRAFRARTAAKQFCALGTVKQNVGHLETAAGVTGLINATQTLIHRQLPPAVDFIAPNSNINLANSPFYINTRLTDWPADAAPRRAGVSSFGVGGTNAHVILEEAPDVPRSAQPQTDQLLVLSAKSASALETATANLARHLRAHPDIDLGSVAFTLQVGRRAFTHRRALVCSSVVDAIQGLECRDNALTVTRTVSGQGTAAVFMFPGQGSQYANMGAELYQSVPEFRADIDTCVEILAPLLQIDLRTLLYHAAGVSQSRVFDLTETRLAQPALFVTEYAMARLWMRWGVHPQAMIGHSVGEFVAACLAGVFSLEDALAIVATRGRMMQNLPPGGMLSVRLGADEIGTMLNGELSLSAANSPNLCVVSGPDVAIATLEKELQTRGVAARRLATSHAFHSQMMDPILKPFAAYLSQFRLDAPKLPFISGVSGNWITEEEATNPAYWASHVREPVQFSAGVRLLNTLQDKVFLEVGPGRVLGTLTSQHRDGSVDPVTVASLPGGTERPGEKLALLQAAGLLWLNGVPLNWSGIHRPEARRCPLPTYPFERERYWIEPSLQGAKSDTVVKADIPVAGAGPRESIEGVSPNFELTTPAFPSPSREERIRTALLEIFSEYSGLTLGAMEQSTSFLELGFDSLFLTQITQAVQTKFGVRVTFRQLLDQVSSLAALAAYLDAKLSTDAFAVAPTTAPMLVTQPPAAPVIAPVATERSNAAAPTNPATIENIVREQLQAFSQLMARQMELIRGALPTDQAAAMPVPPSAAASSPAEPTAEFKPFGPYKPPQRGPAGDLTERQARYLDDFIGRYTARTAGSKEFTQAKRHVLADPRVAAGFRALWKEMVYPIVTVRSKGSRLWDVDGNEYTDFLNGFGPIFFGHSPEFITEAIAAQLNAGFEIGPQTLLAGEVAELVHDLTGNERVTFCNTGSEAVMAALRLARTVTGRKKVVLFAGSYHGTFDEVLVKGGRKAAASQSLPIAPGIPAENVTNMIVLDYGTPDALEYIRRNAHELAAVLVEPVQSRHPELQPVEFLREVRKVTEACQTALIFDEVVTGFRAHPGGVQALFDIRADLVCYGKVAGGGMPIGILAGRGQFMDALDGGMWQFGDQSFPETGVTFFAGTFVRHPLALAASSAVLKRLKEAGPNLQRDLNARTARFASDLNILLKDCGVPTRVEHFASWFYLSFPPDQQYASLLYYHLRVKGFHILEGFPCFLTTAHSEADLESFILAFKESVLELQEWGFLTGPSRQSIVTPAVPTPPARNRELEQQKYAPLTESQMEVWLSASLGDESSCSFNESFALHLRGPLNRAALQKAMQVLVDRHDALRIAFDPDGRHFRVRDSLVLDVPLIDLSARSQGERDASLRAIIREDTHDPFDLAEGQLFRAKLVQMEHEFHTLLVTSHHIICDGWSTNVLLGELSQVYQSLRDGKDHQLPAPMSFCEFALAEAGRTKSPEHTATETWWTEKFALPVVPLEFPTDRPRGSMKSFRGDTVRHVIPSATYQRIKRFGARQGCTLFATVFAGFNTLLHRLTGQTDIVVGIPAAGQSLLDADSLVGHCVNFLPLRISFEGIATVESLLTQVRGTLLDAYDHQNYTYGSLVQKLKLQRDPSRLPLVEVQFNLERVGAGLKFPGLDVRVDPCPKSFVNFDLFLNAVESEEGLILDCDFNCDLLDPATVERWLGHLETLLEEMVADPLRSVSELSLLSDAERCRLIVEWNDTQADFPRNKGVHELIAGQAARTPLAVAAICGDRQLTYAQLDADSNRLAHFFLKRGIGRGDRVAICLDRSVEMLVGLLAVLKAGAAYVPLDPNFPGERVAAILADAHPTLVLTEDGAAARLGLMGDNVVRLDSAWQTVRKESDQPLTGASEPEGPAYVIYTSGSTGKPKGVQVPHRAVVNLLTSMARRPGITAEDRLLAVTTLAFDIAVLELFLPLCVGARVVIAPHDVAGDGYKLLSLMAASGATVMQATPATWSLLLAGGWSGRAGLKVLCGGEALPRDMADQLLERSSSVWNMYGPTETTVWSATTPVERGPGPVTIGPPIANTQFYVLDKAGQIAPVGVAGELHIGGDGVATGYWNQATMTAEKFIADPFCRESSRRMYKTGDLVRYRPDGKLEFLGRLDNQVKVRGFRIETAEVESVLKQCDGVRECVVVAREDTPGDKQLVAYYVAPPPAHPHAALRAFLGNKLPAYMVPSHFVALDALPQTPNGKIDRAALPAPSSVNGGRDRTGTVPRNPRERVLADICADVLKVQFVSAGDDLFELGMNSLQMFQIMARAKDAGVRMTHRQIWMGRSVAAISEELDQSERVPPRADAPQLAPVMRDRYRVPRSSLNGASGAHD
jgi:amino acid adenylation domain-containing protein